MGKYDFTIRDKRSPKERIALVMMIKNEEKRIEVSFDSVKDITNTFIILDTGSTDNTIQIVKDYCQKNNIQLFLKEEPFVNFMVSRNVLLDFADHVLKDKKFLLQLDCNDELRNAENLTKLVDGYTGKFTGFHLKQQWWTGFSYDSYFNIRLVISHSGWRYKGVVHEYITKGNNDGNEVTRCENIILFQDRTKDDDKSQKRFNRDKQLLYTEHIRDKHEPRTLFYLAQTCGCLGNHQEAYQYYILRSKEQGFIEEIFHSFLRLGDLSITLNHPWEESLSWYLKAYAHSKRAEPLVKIADHYLSFNAFGEKKPDYNLSYTFISQACKLMYPHNQILFVDRQSYTYKRWHILGICAYYVNKFKEGKDACIKALQAEDNDIDKKNLVLYLKKDRDINETTKLSNKQFTFESLLPISCDIGDITPQLEKDFLQNSVTRSKEDVLKIGYKLLLGK